jgi:hypothetical protein
MRPPVAAMFGRSDDAQFTQNSLLWIALRPYLMNSPAAPPRRDPAMKEYG